MKWRKLLAKILKVPRNLIKFVRLNEKKLEHDFPEIAIAIGLFILVVVVLIILKRLGIFYYKGSFLENFIGEVHGLGFDILVFGILIVIFNKLSEKRRDIKRYLEEIEDYREWNEKEATYRLVGIIKRLCKLGKNDIDLSFCYLTKARLGRHAQTFADKVESSLTKEDIKKRKEGFIIVLREGPFNSDVHNLRKSKFTRAILHSAILNDIDFKGAIFFCADLQDASLQGANLEDANFRLAILSGVDFRNAKNLTIEQLSIAKTLYGAKFDHDIELQVRKKYPNLFDKPEN